MKEICDVKEFTRDLKHKSITELISKEGIQDKEIVLKYLKSFKPDCAAGMSLTDEITGREVDSGVEGYEDDKYYWDSRHIYHFEKYNLKLNDDFISHVLKK